MSPTRVFFAFPRDAFLRAYEHDYLPLVSKELRQYGRESGFQLAANPEDADLIILLQSAQYKTIQYIKILENDPLIRSYAEKTFVIDYDDHPEGLLAGLYTSIENTFFQPRLHRSWPILFMNNGVVYRLGRDEIFRTTPKRLFSFLGAPSHKIRKQLFALFGSKSPETFVSLFDKWYNHTDEDRARFVSIALESVFCLCPRGYASYTNRIPEVMAMGRVPVIIADDWIPFSFEEKIPYYIKVPEKDVVHLLDILSDHRKDADEYRNNARMLWEKYCSVERRVVASLERIATLARVSGDRMSYLAYLDLWHSKAFLQKCGWTFPQQVALRVEQHLRRWFPNAEMPGVSSVMRYRNAPNLK